MYTNLQLVEYAKKVYDASWVYWYGTCGYECTNALYNSKAKQYPSHYTASRKSGYMRDIEERKMCADCVGLIKSFFWKGGSITGKNVYASNGCPDVSADGMIGLCKETGPIESIPDIPGLVVWKPGHIGIYIGNGYTIEERGFSYDCQMRKVNAGPWTKWGKLPSSMLKYVENEEPEKKPEIDISFEVKVLKGSWNVRTQPNKDSKSIGIVREGDRLPYLNITENGWDKVDYHGAEAWISTKGTEIVAKDTSKKIKVKGTWYVRTKPDKESDSIGSVRTGDYVPYKGTTQNGWYLIEYKGQTAWLSMKAGEIVE